MGTNDEATQTATGQWEQGRGWDYNRKGGTTAMTMGRARKTKQKEGPRDLDEIPWAIDKFFSFSFRFFVSDKLFTYRLELLTKTTTTTITRDDNGAPKTATTSHCL